MRRYTCVASCVASKESRKCSSESVRFLEKTEACVCTSSEGSYMPIIECWNAVRLFESSMRQQSRREKKVVIGFEVIDPHSE